LREGLAARPDAALLALARAGFGPGPIFETLEELLARGAAALRISPSGSAGRPTALRRWTDALEDALAELERELGAHAARLARADDLAGRARALVPHARRAGAGRT
jgi:hypothetical protein